MKKIYEAPILEKVAFVSDDEVCGLFGDLFNVNIASAGNNIFTKDSIFDWEQFESNN